MKIKKILILAVLGAFSLTASGCGNKALQKQIEQGNQAIEVGNYEEALEVFEGLRNSDGDKKEIYRGLGIAYIGVEDYENGIKALKKSLKQADGTVGDWESQSTLQIGWFRGWQCRCLLQWLVWNDA